MSTSLLDILRQRTTETLQNEAQQRAADFGAGMLATPSPNFFTMLAGGARAQREGERTRMDELRRVAEIERQQRALDIEEQRRREELALRREEQAANAPLRAAQTAQALAYGDYLRAGGAGASRMQVTPQVRLRAEAQATNEARTLFPDPPSTAINREGEVERVRRERQAYISQRVPSLLESLGAPGQAATTPTTPAALAVPTIEVNPLGRPAR